MKAMRRPKKARTVKPVDRQAELLLVSFGYGRAGSWREHPGWRVVSFLRGYASPTD